MLGTFTLCVALLAAAGNKADAAKTDDRAAADLAKMQGDWRMASIKTNGIAEPEEVAQSMFRTVEKDRYAVFRYMRKLAGGKFKLDATVTPHTIDSTPDAAPDGPPLLGIYEFDGEILRICNSPPGKPRPKEFGAKLGSLHTQAEWERDTP